MFVPYATRRRMSKEQYLACVFAQIMALFVLLQFWLTWNGGTPLFTVLFHYLTFLPCYCIYIVFESTFIHL